MGVHGSCADDCLPFCAHDGSPFNVYDGPISDIIVLGCVFTSPGSGAGCNPMRFLSAGSSTSITDVTIRAFIGQSEEGVTVVSPDHGGGIKFDDFGAGTVGVYSGIVLSNVHIFSQYVNSPVLTVSGFANVKDLTIDGLKVDSSSSTTFGGALTVQGGNATIGTLQLANVKIDGVANLVNNNGGVISHLTTSNVIHTNAGGGATILNTSGTISRLRSACSDTAVLASGTIASKKTDGTEDS
jgi:hypothetical protein